MGASAGLSTQVSFRDNLSSVSPWTTQVNVRNLTKGPVLLWLARDCAAPRPENAVRHTIAAGAHTAITSGWYNEPRATLLIRTDVHAAQCLRVPDKCQIEISLKTRGLVVESRDEGVVFEDFPDAAAVPGVDTIPMAFHGESFGMPCDAGAAGDADSQRLVVAEAEARSLEVAQGPAAAARGALEGGEQAAAAEDGDVESGTVTVDQVVLQEVGQ